MMSTVPDIEPLPPEDARRRAEFSLGGSETPRTDANAFRHVGIDGELCWADVTRDIERERNQALSLLYRMARFIAYRDGHSQRYVADPSPMLLAELRAMDEERYGREVKTCNATDNQQP